MKPQKGSPFKGRKKGKKKKGDGGLFVVKK